MGEVFVDLDKLRKLNFEKLISIDTPDVSSYSFDDYRKNGFEHKPITGYCVSCENQGCNFGKDDESFQLTNISHGAHSSDFFQALKSSGDIKGWHNQPVMFVYESPSLDYGIYKKVVFQGLRKRPSKDWYWIHEEGEILSYPERFKGGEYGDFVLSAIQTFRLSNVYITNLVKCGLNNREGKFKGLASFRNETIGNCYEQFLEKEISIFKPEVIFAVGSGVEDWLTWFVKVKPV